MTLLSVWVPKESPGDIQSTYTLTVFCPSQLRMWGKWIWTAVRANINDYVFILKQTNTNKSTSSADKRGRLLKHEKFSWICTSDGNALSETSECSPFYFVRRRTCSIFFSHPLSSLLRLLPLQTWVSFFYLCVGPTRTHDRVSLLHLLSSFFVVKVLFSFPSCSLVDAGKQIKVAQFPLYLFRYNSRVWSCYA